MNNKNRNTNGTFSRTHGLSKRRIYRSHYTMLLRCYDKNQRAYPRYGGRGIRVCKRWHKFENFVEDMGEPPTEQHQIDRINNNGNYEPENCRWATKAQQMNNYRNNHKITFNGQTKNLGEWAKNLGIDQKTLWYRITKAKWPIEKALMLPVKKFKGLGS